MRLSAPTYTPRTMKCERCSEPFTALRYNAKYCSDPCKKAAEREQTNARRREQRRANSGKDTNTGPKWDTLMANAYAMVPLTGETL